MSTASAIPALIDQLVVIANAAFGASSPVQVFDGPTVSQDDEGQMLWIGVNNSKNEEGESASSTQVAPYASGGFRREELTIHCMALAWSGDDDFKTVRDQVFTQMSTFATAWVADASMSSVVLMVRSVGENVTYTQGPNDSGVEAQLAFDITALAQYQG